MQGYGLVVPLPLVRPDPQCGRLDVAVGPMGAGKTTLLLTRMNTYVREMELKVLYVNTVLDEKRARTKGDWYSTHNDRMRFIGRVVTLDDRGLPDVVPGEGGMLDVVSTDLLYNVKKLCLMYDVIGIDEGQLFPDLVAFCDEMVKTKHKQVAVVGVDSTASMREFGDVSKLAWPADSFVKVHAVCSMCARDSERILRGDSVLAPFTQKTDEYASDTSVVRIGGSEMYQAVCRRHHRLTAVAPAAKDDDDDDDDDDPDSDPDYGSDRRGGDSPF
jgi:thymidine kinase